MSTKSSNDCITRGGVSLATLEQHYDRPLMEVAKSVGISITMFKKVCRKFGIQRWPHRQIRSIDKAIEELESKLDTESEEEKGIIRKKKLNLLKKKRSLVVRGASSGLRPNLRNAIFLASLEEIEEEHLFNLDIPHLQQGLAPHFLSLKNRTPEIANLLQDQEENILTPSSLMTQPAYSVAATKISLVSPPHFDALTGISGREGVIPNGMPSMLPSASSRGIHGEKGAPGDCLLSKSLVGNSVRQPTGEIGTTGTYGAKQPLNGHIHNRRVEYPDFLSYLTHMHSHEGSQVPGAMVMNSLAASEHIGGLTPTQQLSGQSHCGGIYPHRLHHTQVQPSHSAHSSYSNLQQQRESALLDGVFSLAKYQQECNQVHFPGPRLDEHNYHPQLHPGQHDLGLPNHYLIPPRPSYLHPLYHTQPHPPTQSQIHQQLAHQHMVGQSHALVPPSQFDFPNHIDFSNGILSGPILRGGAGVVTPGMPTSLPQTVVTTASTMQKQVMHAMGIPKSSAITTARLVGLNKAQGIKSTVYPHCLSGASYLGGDQQQLQLSARDTASVDGGMQVVM